MEPIPTGRITIYSANFGSMSCVEANTNFSVQFKVETLQDFNQVIGISTLCVKKYVFLFIGTHGGDDKVVQRSVDGYIDIIK